MKEVKSISFCSETTFYCTKHYFLYQTTADPRWIQFIALTSCRSLSLRMEPWKQSAAVLLYLRELLVVLLFCCSLNIQTNTLDLSLDRGCSSIPPQALSLSLWHINPPQLLHSPRAESSSSKPPFHRGSHHTGAWRVLAGCEFVDCGALWLVNVLDSWAACSGFLMGTNQSRGKQGAVREERDGELERDRAGDGWSHSCDIQYTLLLLYYKHLAQTNALENSRAAVNPAFMQVVTQRILIQTNGQLDMSNLDQHRWAEPVMIWRRL